MKISLIVGAFGGLALASGLFIHYGFAPIITAVATAGWGGLAAICAVHLVSLLLCALAWQLLLVEAPAGAFLAVGWARWLRDSAGNLLAILPAAGELIAARELTFYGISRSLAAATTIIDLTIEVSSQLIFTLLGLALLLVQQPASDRAWWAAVALAAAATAVVGFIGAQRNGIFRLLKELASRLGLRQPFQSLGDVARIDAAIQGIYQHRIRVAGSIVLHLAAWLAGAAETWLGLWLMGYPVSLADALV
ncbi:MAG TPA: lysylphosphatidylglycerol synthase domain-containing protein, partial [Hyphomicrobiaceae bacterium]|nr:lysylphosphatidylglycerol synthase domain-containing protein [Hyphomicrobiaceae bacterium]